MSPNRLRLRRHRSPIMLMDQSCMTLSAVLHNSSSGLGTIGSCRALSINYMGGSAHCVGEFLLKRFYKALGGNLRNEKPHIRTEIHTHLRMYDILLRVSPTRSPIESLQQPHILFLTATPDAPVLCPSHRIQGLGYPSKT